MRVIHRLKFTAGRDSKQISVLLELGIEFEFSPSLGPDGGGDSFGLVAFEIAEDAPEWAQIRGLAPEWNCGDLVRTEFMPLELERAEHLALLASWHHGFPMPDNNFGFLRTTYGGTGCKTCGVGRIQEHSFRMRNEPKWGRNQIMQLNWVTDEFFVTPKVCSTVLSNLEVACQNVVHHKTGTALKTVVQISIPRSAVTLNISDTGETCKDCGARKRLWPNRGFFPSLNQIEPMPIFKTSEYFGGGASAGQAVIVSQSVYRAFTDNGIKGCNFQPLAHNPST